MNVAADDRTTVRTDSASLLPTVVIRLKNQFKILPALFFTLLVIWLLLQLMVIVVHDKMILLYRPKYLPRQWNTPPDPETSLHCRSDISQLTSGILLFLTIFRITSLFPISSPNLQPTASFRPIWHLHILNEFHMVFVELHHRRTASEHFNHVTISFIEPSFHFV